MIKKIDINNFGIYKNFKWDEKEKEKEDDKTLNHFKDINIIYGENYSGKTTLSRIVRALETGSIPNEYSDSEFEITLNDNNNTINQSDFTDSKLKDELKDELKDKLNVKCYNIDFIKENVRFVIDDRSDIEPFAILGKTNQEKLKDIKKIESELGIKYKELEEFEEEIKKLESDKKDQEKAFDNLLKNKATIDSNSIKKNYGDIKYHR